MPRLTTVAAIAVFLLACVYVGYVNELLKDTIAPLHRGVIMSGFVIGAGAVSRYLRDLTPKARVTTKRKRR